MSGNEFAVAIQSGYKQGYEDGAIAELKRIKEKILEHYGVECYGDCTKCEEKGCFNDIGLMDATNLVKNLKIIDKRLAELKGE